MKIRQGFVSNSSSTSFCIAGIILEHPEEQIWDKYSQEYEDCYTELVYQVIDKFSISSQTPCHLEVYYNSEYGGDIYLGIPVSTMKDEQTLGELKEQAKQAILAIAQDILYSPPEDMKIEILEQCWSQY